jgi:hypothetical protein
LKLHAWHHWIYKKSIKVKKKIGASQKICKKIHQVVFFEKLSFLKF